jgi:hypothetical protein
MCIPGWQSEWQASRLPYRVNAECDVLHAGFSDVEHVSNVLHNFAASPR